MMRRIGFAIIGGPPPDGGRHSVARYRWLRNLHARASLGPLVPIILGLVWGESSVVFWALMLVCEAGALSGVVEYTVKLRRAAQLVPASETPADRQAGVPPADKA